MSGAPDASVGGMVFGQTLATSPITADELDTVIQNRTTPLNEYWGAAFTSAAEHTVPGAYYQAMQVPQDDLGAAISPLQEPPAGSEVVTTGYTKFGPNRYLRSDVPVMTEEDWKASPDYRAAIPFDGRMTEARAKAKAEIYDADQYRAWLRQNRPWGIGTVAAATTATLAGGAIDLSNYIPLFGPAFRAANMTRAAAIMARAGIGALDAGLVTAITEPYIASSRRQFGEDTSFADQILDIALGAATGGIAGSVHGAFERIHLDRLDDTHPAKVQARLQTLGEAADALARDEPLDIGPSFRRSLLSGSTLSRGDVPPADGFRFGDEAAPVVSPADRAVADWQSRVESVAREAEPDAWARRDELLDQQDTLRSQLEAAAPVDTRSAIDDQINYARGQYFDAAHKDKPRYQRALNALYAEQARQSHGVLVRDDTPQQAAIRQQLQAVDTQLRDIAPTVAASLRKGEAVHARPEIPAEARAAAPSGTPVENFGAPVEPTVSPFDQAIADTADLPRVTRTVQRASLDTVARDRPGTPQATLDTANAAVGKPQTFATDAGAREIAAEHGINPETGDFEEMGDIKRLADAEQLNAEETKALKESDATVKRAADYAKAYQAAASCLGRT